jgi:uncharacterized protein YndB with AHSA1/START domain
MNEPIVTKDFAKKQITIEKSFAAPRSKVWRAYTDDTLLIKWWGPKEWPASSKSFDFRPGGHWHYYMTGPDGTEAWGMLHYLEISPEDYFIAEDEFSNPEGTKDATLPTNHWKNEFIDQGDTTKTLVTLTFSSDANMQTLIDMGFEAGFADALDNLDHLLPQI